MRVQPVFGFATRQRIARRFLRMRPESRGTKQFQIYSSSPRKNEDHDSVQRTRFFPDSRHLAGSGVCPRTLGLMGGVGRARGLRGVLDKAKKLARGQELYERIENGLVFYEEVPEWIKEQQKREGF